MARGPANSTSPFTLRKSLTMDFFDRLGTLIGQRWRARNCDELSFPDVALRALQDLPPHQHVTMWEIAQRAITAPQLPQQEDPDSKFGEPPLTVYNGRGFHIDVLFWADGIPAIHQHAFSGAFHVLQGSSLHTLWEFDALERIEMRLLLGRTQFKSVEVLTPGEVRPILPGKQMIHATFHLEHPSATIVVRTTSEVEHRPQYSYLPPTIAFAQNHEIPLIKRQTELLRMLLLSGQRSVCYETARHLCGTVDAYSLFNFIRSMITAIPDEDLREVIFLSARRHHPALIDALEPVLVRDEVGNRILQARRVAASNRELSYFLALLRNIPNRAAIFDLIRQRHPGRDPIALVRNWIRKLSDIGALGIRIPGCWLVATEGLLQRRSQAEILSMMTERCKQASIPSTEAQVRDLTSSLQEFWLLQPLLHGIT